MSFAEDVAHDIWQSDGFRADYNQLLTANIFAHLQPVVSNGKQVLLARTTAKLLQSAMVFASCDDSRFREAAQHISTGILRVAQDEAPESVNTIFRCIQGRLRNFPSLKMINGTQAPRMAPLSLQYEFVSAREEQTVELSIQRSEVLTSFQRDAWSKMSLHRSAALSAPTSAGKSYVILNYVLSRLTNEARGLFAYIVPTRALINQVAEDFQRRLADQQANAVSVSTIPVYLGAAAGTVLYVLTQERLERLLLDNPQLRLENLVIDEAQMIGESSRGVLLESVLDRVLTANPETQIIFSGPIIENPDYFGDMFQLTDFVSSKTDQATVTQNLVFLKTTAIPESKVSIEVEGPFGHLAIADIALPIRLITDADKLSYLSFYFGRSGSSIVYAEGKADAEKIAIKIAGELPIDERKQTDLSELIGFVKQHVHKDYALVETLEKGVAFHYGHMPTLLRKELERHFNERRINYIVCTSTLLYGVNLPAKNIFLLKPTTGRSTAIDGPDFWNLAGRVGRMGKELEGNVYLIDYDQWATKPVQERRSITVSSALRSTLVEQNSELLAFLRDPLLASEAKATAEIAAGKLILDYRKGRLDNTLARYLPDQANADEILKEVARVSDSLELPSEILDRNIAVSVFRQKDLYDYFLSRMEEIDPIELIPAHPLSEFRLVQGSYRRAFKRIHTYLLRYRGDDRRHNLFSMLAIRWMRGNGLPQLISSAIKYNKDTQAGKSTAAIIRETMEQIEKHLRFRYVKYFSCYNSLLALAFEKSNRLNYIESIPDVPLFLEMGASSGVTINLMALGLSRTTAISISDYVTDKEMQMDRLRDWLAAQNFNTFDISPVCVREIEGLLGREPSAQ